MIGPALTLLLRLKEADRAAVGRGVGMRAIATESVTDRMLGGQAVAGRVKIMMETAGLSGSLLRGLNHSSAANLWRRQWP